MNKILIITPTQYGYNNNFRYYAKYLSNLYDVTSICMDNGLPKIDDNNVNVIYISNIKFRFFNSKSNIYYFIIRVILLLFKNKSTYNVIITKSFHFLNILFPLLNSSFFVIDIQSGNLSENFVKRYLKNYLLKLSTVTYNKIFVLCDSLRDYLKLPSNKTYIIPIGAKIISNQEKDFTNLNLLYVGTLNKRRIEDTIEGVNLFLKSYDFKIKFNYDIIGFGSRKNIELIINKINNYNLGEYIHFHGRKSQDELSVFFDKANVGICYVPITKYYQYQPSTKLIEYSLSGLYTIATSTYENTRMVNNDNGVVCLDNPSSFSKALNDVFINLHKLNYDKIRTTLHHHEWSYIVNNSLLVHFKAC